TPCDRAADSGAGEVREVRLGRRAVPCVETRVSDVDRPRVPVPRDLDRPAEILRDPQAADEVLSGPARKHRELGVERAAGCDEAVHRLVDGTVAADHDEDFRPALDGNHGELAEVAGRLGDERLAPQAASCRLSRDLGPAASGRSVRGRRIDEKDGLGQCLSPAVAVASATFVMRSTAARSSSSEMRLNSPSTTMSLTVSRQPPCTPRNAATVNSAAASISTARTPRFDQRSYWPSSGL